jgi:hypothetical protein
MTQKVIITVSKEDLIKIVSKHFDLQASKTSIKLNGDSPRDSFPNLVIESDRERQSEVKTYNQTDR